MISRSRANDIEIIERYVSPERHSYHVVVRLFMAGALSIEQIALFTRAQLDGLYEGLTPMDVDHPWFTADHVTAARLRLPKQEYLTASFSRSHVEALNAGYHWNTLKNLLESEVISLRDGLSRSQAVALKRFGLTKEEVNHVWFNKTTLIHLVAGKSIQEALYVSRFSYGLSAKKHHLVNLFKLDYAEAEAWHVTPQVQLIFYFLANDRKFLGNNDQRLYLHLLSFLLPLNVNAFKMFKKLTPVLHKPALLSRSAQSVRLKYLKTFSVFRASRKIKNDLSVMSVDQEGLSWHKIR